MIATTSRCPQSLSPAAAARARCAARGAQPADEGAGSERGWFESSYDLSAGLTVTEHPSLDGDTLELAVALWLQ